MDCARTGYRVSITCGDMKRRGGDLNPRGLSPDGFQDRCNRPLCHPSTVYSTRGFPFRDRGEITGSKTAEQRVFW